MEKISVSFRQQNYELDTMATPLQFLKNYELPVKEPVAAVVNGVISSLMKRIRVDSAVDFIELGSPGGNRIYQSSLVFLFLAAFKKIHPEKEVFIQHSISNGVYAEVKGSIAESDIAEIKEKMDSLVKAEIGIKRVKRDWDIGLREFRKQNRKDMEDLLRYYTPNILKLYNLEGNEEQSYLPLVPNTRYLKSFDLLKYHNGVLILFPDFTVGSHVGPFVDQPKLFQTYQENLSWYNILKVRTVGQLNHHIMTDEIDDLIKVAESLHEKKVAQIADMITKRTPVPRLILISGPSSSGKTTFSKRLGIQLRVNGFRPLTISLDDYFLDREKTPKDEKGEYDFESLGAIDVPLFCDHLTKLLNGESVEIPRFDFRKGQSRPSGQLTKLDPDQLIIVEGIHGLNPKLTFTIPSHEKFKIYISALTQLNIHNHSRIPTSDTRAIRRIVRDNLYRGYSAEETLSRWPAVRSGEHKNIFPSQEEADVVFNSAICYELAVLKPMAERELLRVQKNSPVYPEARRLLKFLSYFLPLYSRSIPRTSILCEFIGDSSFKYK